MFSIRSRFFFGPLVARASFRPIIDEALSSTPASTISHVTPEYPGHAAAARKLRPLPSGSFYKVLFFRNAGPTIVFLRYAFAHSYRFLQSGPRYIGTLPIPSFSASDFVLPPRHARLESVFCREFTRSLGYSYVVAALRRLAG